MVSQAQGDKPAKPTHAGNSVVVASPLSVMVAGVNCGWADLTGAVGGHDLDGSTPVAEALHLRCDLDLWLAVAVAHEPIEPDDAADCNPLFEISSDFFYPPVRGRGG